MGARRLHECLSIRERASSPTFVTRWDDVVTEEAVSQDLMKSWRLHVAMPLRSRRAAGKQKGAHEAGCS